MKTNTAAPSYKRHRYPAEIIAHTVWLYFRFSLSFRDVEELMAVRGVSVSYETVRRWTLKFGQQYANQLRRRRPQPGDKWHIDGYCHTNFRPMRMRGKMGERRARLVCLGGLTLSVAPQ